MTLLITDYKLWEKERVQYYYPVKRVSRILELGNQRKLDCETVREYVGLRNETQQFIRENK